MKRIAILLACATFACACACADVVFAVHTGHAALVVQDTRFVAGVQLMSRFDASVAVGERAGSAALGWHIALGGGAGYATPSVTNGSYLYRGVVTRSAFVGGDVTWASGFGMMAKADATFASYDATTRIFFYPTVAIGPTWQTRLFGPWSVRWALPVAWDFREDLAWALEAGLEASILLEIAPR